MKQAAPPDKGWRGSRQGWLDAAYEALIEGGIDAVKIQPLARRLGLSRTSFYWFFGEREAFAEIRAGRFFKAISRDDSTLKPFDTFLKGNGARCGQIRDAQRDFLFGKETDEVGSAALIPLGSGSETGFLAIGSADSNRFHPGMSIDFLGRLGELVAEALKRF